MIVLDSDSCFYKKEILTCLNYDSTLITVNLCCFTIFWCLVNDLKKSTLHPKIMFIQMYHTDLVPLSPLFFCFRLLYWGERGMEIGFLGKGDIFHLDIKYTQKQKALLISKHMD